MDVSQETRVRSNLGVIRAIFECSICCNVLSTPSQLVCGHLFCGDCIKSILRINKTDAACPNCRSKLNRRAVKVRDDVSQLNLAVKYLEERIEYDMKMIKKQQSLPSSQSSSSSSGYSETQEWNDFDSLTNKRNQPLDLTTRRIAIPRKCIPRVYQTAFKYVVPLDLSFKKGSQNNNNLKTPSTKNILPIKNAKEVENLSSNHNGEEIENMLMLPIQNDEEVENISSIQNAKELENISSNQNGIELENMFPIQNGRELENMFPIQNGRELENVSSIQNGEEVKNISSIHDGGELENKNKISQQKSQSQRKKFLFCPSRLNRVELAKLSELCKVCQGEISRDYVDEVTHLIIKLEKGRVPQTMKYLFAIADKKWIVIYDWVNECVTQGEMLPEDMYETSCFPECDSGVRRSRLNPSQLLNGVCVYFPTVLKSSGAAMDECKKLVMKMGGSVVNSPSEIEPDQSILIIGEGIQSRHLYQEWYKSRGWLSISWSWVLDCLLSYRIIPFAKTHFLTNLDGESQICLPKALISVNQFSPLGEHFNLNGKRISNNF